MDFHNVKHPDTPTLHAKREDGTTILELVQLCKSFGSGDPLLGYEVWSYTESPVCPLGTVTYHATEEPEPWRFETHVPRWRAGEQPVKTWAATMPAALAEPFAKTLKEIEAEEAHARR